MAQQNLDIVVRALDQASGKLADVTARLDALTAARKKDDAATTQGAAAGGAFAGVMVGVGAAVLAVNQGLELAAKAWQFLTAAISAARVVLDPAIKQAIEQEQVDRRQAVALRNLADARGMSVSSLRAYADALQGVTGMSNEAIQGVQTTLMAIGRLSGPDLTRATDAVVNFSAQTGRGLEETALMVAKAANGVTTAMQRIGIVIPEGAAAAEKFEAALSGLERIGGDAGKALGQTFGGGVQILTENFGDMEKALGEVIIAVPELRDLINAANQAVVGLTDAITGSAGPISVFVSDLANATAILSRFASAAALIGATLAQIELQKLTTALVALSEVQFAGMDNAAVDNLRALLHSVMGTAQGSAAGLRALAAQLLVSSTAAQTAIAEKRKLRAELAALEAQAAASGGALSQTLIKRITELRTELGLVKAPDVTGTGLAGMNNEVTELINKLREASPLLKELFDLRGDTGFGEEATASLQGFVEAAAQTGDAAAVEILRGLAPVAPGIAALAEDAFRQIDARELAESLAKGGQEGALRILASMHEVAPELASAASEALSRGFDVGADEARKALRTLGAEFSDLFDLRLSGDIGPQVQTVLGSMVRAAETAGNETQLTLLRALAPVGSGLRMQIEDSLSRIRADALLEELVKTGEVGALKILESLEGVPEAIKEATARGLDEIKNLDIKNMGEHFVRFEWDSEALLEMGAALTGMTEEMETQLVLQGEAVLGQEEFWALVEASFDATTNLADAMQLVTDGVDDATKGLKKTELVQGIILDTQTAIANSMAQMGAALVASALGAEKSFLKAAGKILQQLAIMITQAIIFRAIMSSFGGGGLMFGGGGQVPNTAAIHPPGFAAHGGQVQAPPAVLMHLPGAQAGGQIIGTRTGRDTVPIVAMPGEVIVRNDVVKFVEEAVLAQAAHGSTTPGFSFNLFFNNVIRRDTVEELMIEMTHLVENKGAVLTSSNVFD